MTITERLIKSQSHKKLRRLESYLVPGKNEIASYAQEIVLQNAEEIIGVYENFRGESRESIIITSRGIYVNEEGWKRVLFEEIAYVETPKVEEKHSVNQLTLHLHSGQIISIPIRGGKGRLRDAWAFVSFFNRILPGEVPIT